MWPDGENFSAILPLDLTGRIYYNFFKGSDELLKFVLARGSPRLS
jgi:hypothetical protein